MSSVEAQPDSATVAETRACGACGRHLGKSNTQPRWVFDHAGQSLGLMHTSCANGLKPRRASVSAAFATEEEAQFLIWTERIKRSEDQTLEFALVMAWGRHPSLQPGELSGDQLAWLERRPAEQRPAIRQAYDELLAQFLAWRDALRKARSDG